MVWFLWILRLLLSAELSDCRLVLSTTCQPFSTTTNNYCLPKSNSRSPKSSSQNGDLCLTKCHGFVARRSFTRRQACRHRKMHRRIYWQSTWRATFSKSPTHADIQVTTTTFLLFTSILSVEKKAKTKPRITGFDKARCFALFSVYSHFVGISSKK